MCRCPRVVAVGLLALSIVCITPMLAGAADLQPNPDRRGVIKSSSLRGCPSVWRSRRLWMASCLCARLYRRNFMRLPVWCLWP